MIDDETLDHLLTRSAPQPVHPADCLACAAARPVRRTSRRRRATVSVVGAGVLVGVAGTAAALGGLPFVGDDPVSGTRTVSSGSECRFTFEIVADGVPDDSPVVRAGREILAGIDIAAIDISDAVASMDEYRAEHPEDFFEPPVGTQQDMTERSAVSMVVAQTVLDGVREQGLDPQGIQLRETDRCDIAP